MSQPTTELDVATAISVGELPSPTRFFGTEYFALRISGTGVAYRPALKEYCWRNPAIWLGEKMQRRVLGLAVVFDHPESRAINAAYVAANIAGIIVLSFVRPDDQELWGVMRAVGLSSKEAAMLSAGDYDTSPGAIWKDGTGSMIEIRAGERLLVESEPALIDHVAICARGVWSKGGDAARGVEITKELTV